MIIINKLHIFFASIRYYYGNHHVRRNNCILLNFINNEIHRSVDCIFKKWQHLTFRYTRYVVWLMLTITCHWQLRVGYLFYWNQPRASLLIMDLTDGGFHVFPYYNLTFIFVRVYVLRPRQSCQTRERRRFKAVSHLRHSCGIPAPIPLATTDPCSAHLVSTASPLLCVADMFSHKRCWLPYTKHPLNWNHRLFINIHIWVYLNTHTRILCVYSHRPYQMRLICIYDFENCTAFLRF